ncbi:AB1gp44 [Acinetobacter phage AB1]|uniref:AB1gp44 n=1 Tax=Acinetobacter phage AB1 TaxID=889876 RepID=E2GLY2_9CAUD|nr:AB1gp44 [Acinetobacter phage AB1]ADO14415.1 AB1gp44 [Acinetobacter phage AB1]
MKDADDKVNQPSHYANFSIECIDAMQAMLSRDEFIGYLRGNIFKYLWRYKLKNGVEDLKKAQWYQNKLIEVEENE